MLSTETTQSIYTERDYMYVSDWQRRRHFILLCRGIVCYLLALDLYLPVWENSDGRPGNYILNCLNIVIYGAQNLTVYASTKVHEFSEQNLLFQSFVHHTCKFFNICNSYIIYTKWYYLHWAGYIFISGNITMRLIG